MNLKTGIVLLMITALIGLGLISYKRDSHVRSKQVGVVHPPDRPVATVGEGCVVVNHTPRIIPATVEVGKATYSLKADALGNYPQIKLPSGSSAKVKLEIGEGESIAVQLLDGGSIDSKVKLLPDKSGNVSFIFTPRANSGSHRISVNVDGFRRVLEFWTEKQSVNAS